MGASENDNVLDFGLEDEPTVLSSEDVVRGAVVIYAGFTTADPISELSIVVRETVKKLCYLETAVLMTLTNDIKTFGSARVGLIITFDALCRRGQSGNCLDRLSVAGYGAPDPPFGGSRQMPRLRSLLKVELAEHGPTSKMGMDEWFVRLQNLSCKTTQVLSPVWYGNLQGQADGVSSSACGMWGSIRDSDSYLWKPSPNALAHYGCGHLSSACMCATTQSCTWSLQSSGSMRCVHEKESPGVDCSHCSAQPSCPLDPAVICSFARSPCACVDSVADCRWSEDRSGSGRCVQRLGGSTLCKHCPRQPSCTPLAVSSIQPPARFVSHETLLGAYTSNGKFINITYDRAVKTSQYDDAHLRFQCQWTREEAELESTQRYLELKPPTYLVPYQFLAIEGSTLVIDVTGVANDVNRNCELIIPEGLVRGAVDDLPFMGMSAGIYFFGLGDTTGPKLQSAEPPNGAIDVGSDVTVSFRFNEDIIPRYPWWGGMSRRRIVQLFELGVSAGLEDGRADVAIADCDADSVRLCPSPVVTTEGDCLLLNLGGIIEAGKLYSLTLAPGVVGDHAGNSFVGLSHLAYTFRTKPLAHTISSETHNQISPGLIFGLCSAALALALLCALSCIVSSKVRAAKQRLSSIEEQSIDWDTAAAASQHRTAQGNYMMISLSNFYGIATSSWSNWKNSGMNNWAKPWRPNQKIQHQRQIEAVRVVVGPPAAGNQLPIQGSSSVITPAPSVRIDSSKPIRPIQAQRHVQAWSGRSTSNPKIHAQSRSKTVVRPNAW